MAVNAAGASRQPQTLGPLVGGVGGLGKVAPAIGTNATHDERVPRNDRRGMTACSQVQNAGDVSQDVESWCRELNGALVNFGDGAVVTKVSFRSDFSAVRISHLPQPTTASSVVHLLVSLGFAVPEGCVRISAPADNTYCSADIRVEDSLFAKHFCSLPAMKRHDASRAVPINAPMPQTTNYRRVDSKKVYCSWHKPTKTAWLNFGNGDIAAKVGSKFSAGIYKVLNQRVQCEGPTRGAGNWNQLAWTIRLLDVPKLAKKEHVTRDIPAGLAPCHVELSTASYDVDLPMANTLIESSLLQAGPLDRWEGSPEMTGKRFKAKARFLDDADARQAVKLFHNKPLPFNNHGKLTVQLVHSARLKIPTRVYDAVEQEIADHKQAWASQHLLYTAYPPTQGLRVLKIEGEIGKDVASAKATLENIIGGEVMMKDGKAVWVPSFAANGRAYQIMKQLERELGILIVRDKRRSQLRLLGPRPRCDEAQSALIELAKADSSSIFVIELDTQQFSQAFKGGYRAVAAAIGDDKVILDIASSPRRILVAGSEADFNVAQKILHGGEGVSRAKSETGSISDCAICWTEAENPVHTPCKHVYCAGCFEDLCFAGINSGACIRCQGDAGRCGEVLRLTELQAYLSSAALEDLLETAFRIHVTRHLNDLRYCPTPDCGQMYRAANLSGHSDDVAGTGQRPLFICPACLVAVCRVCNVSHDGLTCAEQRDSASGGYEALRAAKEKLGIKDCPKCGIMIEKTFGCNHMTCSACGVHICWVCMKTFQKGNPVYDHMNREHGGIGVQYFPGLD
ncbi:uncharacterized protein B0I36DRAFT_378516 [Microdochium trichocladiopsis]|uniref:RING-type domain-containing protein n=1 Tax=Microdochium trichocladiopsis TaxID=1682393 RepID=A0A9P9BHJ8_9PEZI|nr:uncharacterized protein B0I36DRAFT_378516 [Microdochium trichocladiopsis]KAH7010862.1 hypothetical protein B0I36DRAFT_378516 [Microdochium trichocladiopsis]